MNSSELANLQAINTLLEGLFALDMVRNFFTEKIKHDSKPERNLVEIWKQYLKGAFIFDFIALLPLFWLADSLIEGE